MAVKKGNQKPTKSVILSTAKSDYKRVVDRYEKSNRKSRPWQTNLLKPIMAKNRKGLWVHTKVGYAVPRRNGKNEVIVQIEIDGLEEGISTLHTAHRVSTTHSSYERLIKVLNECGYVEDEDFTSLKAKGQERIEFLKTGGKIEFRTRTSKGGLGEGFDRLIIDEAQEYTDDQESALKYTVSDSANPQTIFCGTPPTVYSSGTVFTKLRNDALEGKTKNTMWAEWSVEDMTDMHDKTAWYLTNPSLGYQLTERAIEDEIGTDDVDFNIQRLGLWLKYNQKSAISESDWNNLKVNLPKLKGKIFIGIKYGVDGNNVSLSIAVKTNEDKIFIEVIDCVSVRNGNQWLLNFLKETDFENVAIDGASYQAVLAAEMKDYGIKKKPILPTVKEIITANSLWENAIYQRSMCHAGQPSLTDVATNCEKRSIGTTGGFGYKSQYQERDIVLMDSAILAHWICSITKPKQKRKIIY